MKTQYLCLSLSMILCLSPLIILGTQQPEVRFPEDRFRPVFFQSPLNIFKRNENIFIKFSMYSDVLIYENTHENRLLICVHKLYTMF